MRRSAYFILDVNKIWLVAVMGLLTMLVHPVNLIAQTSLAATSATSDVPFRPESVECLRDTDEESESAVEDQSAPAHWQNKPQVT